MEGVTCAELSHHEIAIPTFDNPLETRVVVLNLLRAIEPLQLHCVCNICIPIGRFMQHLHVTRVCKTACESVL